MRLPRSLVSAVTAGVLMAGCGEVADRSDDLSDLKEVFRQLHEPVYRVYELGIDRDAIHGHLAASFGGEALTEQYVEHYTTLVRMAREKTSIRVVRVDYEEVHVDGESGEIGLGGIIEVEADWSVGGIVTHQEHKHLRTNRYQALYQLARTASGWRIVATRLRDLRRVETGLGLSSDLPVSAGGLMSPLELLRAGVGDDLPSSEDEDLPGSEDEDPSP